MTARTPKNISLKLMNIRTTRYQGVILRRHHILLIQHREHQSGHSYWLLPGGGLEPGESEEACVRREMREETGLEVKVERLLLEGPELTGKTYERRKIYLCRPLSGEARPGYEPEPGPSARYAITNVCWLDLRDESAWDEAVKSDPYTYPELRRIREILGYR